MAFEVPRPPSHPHPEVTALDIFVVDGGIVFWGCGGVVVSALDFRSEGW